MSLNCKEIGDWFKEKKLIKEVILGDDVISIGNDAFNGCSSLTSVTIPNSVTSIGDHAFSECSSLTSVTIPNSVTSIGNHAFSGCTGLTSVNIPNGVTSIENGLFSNCSGLTSVTISNNVNSIGDDAFYQCSGLKSITIGNSVNWIGRTAFYCKGSLVSIYVHSLTPPKTSGAVPFLTETFESTNLYVPTGTIEYYKKADCWKRFKNISEFDATDIKVATNENIFEVARYNINGKLISSPQKGVNIVKMSDGSIKKVIVK